MDITSLRVHSPTPLLFLCGGEINAKSEKPPSLREAFSRLVYGKPFKKYSTLISEELNAFFPKGHYRDILTFEAHIAQISELIVLFSESFGSAAELGAFSMVKDIAHRLLVVIDDKNYNDESFISLGPIRALENKFGETSICVLNRADIGIKSIEDVADVKFDALSAHLSQAINARGAASKEHSTFNPQRPGHIIKLIVGLIQHYGALTLDEIETHLFCIGQNAARVDIENYLLCAEFADWIMKDKRGIHVYFTALSRNKAIQFDTRKGLPELHKDRWRSDIMEHWRENDTTRFSSIQSAIAKG
ncbi:retron St85 family effector protein [Tardiphaga sp. 803_E3_N1_3]|uniref:retron St85 family effector protein n=1 Tax=Tardiphaga sp. 803_E3_N1_3 TaxID=3240785 RepID=UPI003F22FFF0